MATTPPVEQGPSRVARKRARRMQEIVAVAAQLFGERGYEAVTVEEVADRLDVTKGSIYYYFPSKDELGTAAIEALGDDWMTRLEELSAAHDGPPGPRLRALIREQMTIAVRDYPAALGMFLMSPGMPEAQRERIRRMRRRHDQVFRSVVEQGVASGDFTVTTVDAALRCMHAAMSEAPAWYGSLRGARLAAALDELADTLMMLVGELPDRREEI